MLVRYSLDMREGDFWPRAAPVAAPLVEACYREALLVGAHPHIDVRLPRLDEIHFRTASDAELAWISPVTRYLMENADANSN